MQSDLLAFDRNLLIAYGVMGTVWVGGLAAFVFLFNQEFVPVAAGYVFVFTLAIASKRIPTGWALATAWAAAVLATGVVMNGADTLPGEAAFLGAFLGTALFALWVLPSYLLLIGMNGDSTGVR